MKPISASSFHGMPKWLMQSATVCHLSKQLFHFDTRKYPGISPIETAKKRILITISGLAFHCCESAAG